MTKFWPSDNTKGYNSTNNDISWPETFVQFHLKQRDEIQQTVDPLEC